MTSSHNVDIRDKVLDYLREAFVNNGEPSAERVIVGHQKIRDNQIVVRADGRLIVIDPTFAEKGGKVGMKDATEFGGGLRVTDNERVVIKFINMAQVFMDKSKFIDSIKRDKEKVDENFESLTQNIDFGHAQLAGLRLNLLKRLTLRDIDSNSISLDLDMLDYLGSNFYQEKLPSRLNLFGELSEIVSYLEGKTIDNVSDVQEFLRDDRFGGKNSKINKDLVVKLVKEVKIKENGKVTHLSSTLDYKPQRFNLPVILAKKRLNDNEANEITFEIRLIDNDGEDLVILDSEEEVDKLNKPSRSQRLTEDVTPGSINFIFGNVTDEIQTSPKDGKKASSPLVEFNRSDARGIIAAYQGRSKGDPSNEFVDHTRNGGYLKIDPTAMRVWRITFEEYVQHSNTYEDGLKIRDPQNRIGRKTDGDQARGIIAAYQRRSKGTMQEAFVDHTRQGSYLKVDPIERRVWILTQEEYAKSTLPRYEDGIKFSAQSSSPLTGIEQMAEITVPASNDVGGIDMNSIDLEREGAGVDIHFDPAELQEIIESGIDGFAPVIINITPLPSVLPLLGLEPATKEEQLEVSRLD
ncbi:MAG: hypothetical protein HZA28_03155 [Candidatus Omnitrophica bacterium]|nr:hypothetical protein [Candidatus Omnitrophota bacterium]